MVDLWTQLSKTVTLHHVEAHTGRGDILSLGNAKADELATMATGNTPTAGGSILSSHLPTMATGGGHLATAATGSAGSCLTTMATCGTHSADVSTFASLIHPAANTAGRTLFADSTAKTSTLPFNPYSTPNILSLF